MADAPLAAGGRLSFPLPLRRHGSGASRPGLALPVGVATISAVLGVAVGTAWDRLAPHPEATVTADGQLTGSATSPQAYFGAEAWFLGLCVAAGVLCALVAFALLGARAGGNVATLLGLVAGGLLGAVVAWVVGRSMGPAALTAHGVPTGSTVHARVDLHAYGVLLAWGIAAAVVHVALTAGFGVDEHDHSR